MELLQLKYFRVIAETENISKAAEQLYIAQPSLSMTLKRLEDELGIPLFDRNGKKKYNSSVNKDVCCIGGEEHPDGLASSFFMKRG